MTHPLIIRPEAEQDMADGRDWYEGHQEGLSVEFLTAVDQVFDRIRETPELYVPEYRAVRRAGLNRSPYIVYYRIVAESVEVIAVQHGSRNPRSGVLGSSTGKNPIANREKTPFQSFF